MWILIVINGLLSLCCVGDVVHYFRSIKGQTADKRGESAKRLLYRLPYLLYCMTIWVLLALGKISL